VIDARDPADYVLGHIPGAVSINWEDWNVRPPQNLGLSLDLSEPGYWGRLANPWQTNVEARLSALGLENNKPALVYADALRSKGREGRVAWMLLYFGVKNVMLLNGGWSAWLTAGGEAEIGTGATHKDSRSVPKKTHFQLLLDPRRKMSCEALARRWQAQDMPELIDTRSIEEFRGESYDYQPRPGRLPNARFFDYTKMFDEEANGAFAGQRTFVPNHAEVRAQAHSSLSPGCANAVAYCEVGVRAALYALLHEVYTGEIMPVFDGSIMEWSAHKALPVIGD
jgi:thiosulfate/3-mercaptopyruvate sulfurtransferase